MSKKPLGHKAYGSIPHLPGSKKLERDDKGLNPGQTRLLTEEAEPNATVVVTEKLDGTCVSIANIDGEIVPLIRAGYRADTSRWKQHHLFAKWAMRRWEWWNRILKEGERLCGEWLAQAHAVKYNILNKHPKLPFRTYDLMRGHERTTHKEIFERFSIHSDIRGCLWTPVLHVGDAISIDDAMSKLGKHGHAGAIDKAEGVVYRYERDGRVLFTAKYVRRDFEAGRYLPGIGRPKDAEPIWNWQPETEAE